jgi:hypothetical protein
VRKKHAKQPQEDQRRKYNMRERFIKNKRSLNLLHIFLKKEKQPKSRTTERAILMSQFDDDDEQETLQKRQRRQEDIIMKGSMNLQQTTKLLRRQQ